MKMKRIVALTLSALLMLTLFLALPVMPAKAGGTSVPTITVGNASKALYVSNFTSKIYINTSFIGTFNQETDSWCEYDPTIPNRLTLIQSATVEGYIKAEGGKLDICINDGVTLNLNGVNSSAVSDKCYGIYMDGGALSIFGNGTLNINNANTNAKGDTYVNNAAIYADNCSGIRLSGGCTVTATGGNATNASNGASYGVYLSSGFGTALSVADGNKLTGTSGSAGRESYGISTDLSSSRLSIHVEKGGEVIGTSGAVSADGVVGRSYGVVCHDIFVSGTLSGTGGAVKQKTADYQAYSAGVFCDGGEIIVDGGKLTGTAGAATAQYANASVYGVRANGITLTGNKAVLEGSSLNNSNAGTGGGQATNYGVYSDGTITVGETCELVGSAGDAIGGTGSYSYGVYSKGSIDVSGSLTGKGGGAKGSYGVFTWDKDITVSGSLTGSGSWNGSGSGLDATQTTSYGVNVGSGKVTISGKLDAFDYSSLNSIGVSIGVSAGGGIELTGNGHLTARSGATATLDSSHCAKIPKDGAGVNALTAGADAAWRGSSTAAFESLAATYIDTTAYRYLEVQNNPSFKVTPASVSVGVGYNVTLTAEGVANNENISWYVSNAQTYDNATALTGENNKTLTFTPGSDHNTKYYFAKLTRNGNTFYSNIVPVTAMTYGIELTPANDYRFPGKTVGYTAAPDERDVSIKNTGNAPTGHIVVTLSGTNADSFTASPNDFTDFPSGSNTYFYVQPKENLGVGTYTATVTVGPASDNPNAEYITPRSFAVTFIVAPAPEVSISGNTTIVKGESTTLTAIIAARTGTGECTYQWSTGATEKWITVSPDQSTDYSVLVTDECGVTASASVTVTVELPRYGLAFDSLSELTETTPPTVDFGTLAAGYTQPDAKTIVVQNTGNMDARMQALKFAVPEMESSYTVVKQTPWDDTLTPQGTKSFTIQPNANLAPGTYNTTINIPCDDTQSTIPRAYLVLSVKFTVVEPTYAVALTMTLDSAAYSGLTVNLKSTGAEYALAEEGASGVYKNAAVPAGSYTVYVGGVSTGETLTVTDDYTAALAYYTVSFEPNGGTPAPAKQIILSGGKASTPAAMTNGAMSFGGWYQDEAMTSPWTFTTDTVTKTLTLRAKWTSTPAFAAQPTSKAAALGTAVTFTAEATGVPAPTYQWQLSIDSGAAWNDIQGATGASYTIPTVTLAMNGQQFRCVAVNAQGSVTSDAATLTVVDPNAEIVPRDHFDKGDAPALTVIVGHGLPGLTVNNLGGVAVLVGGVRTSLIRDVHYEAFTSGSIHIVPKQSWLNTLNPGDYPVDITLKGGAYEGLHVYTRFTVTAPTPATGDYVSPALWIGLLAASLLALCFVLWKRRKAKA